MKIKYKISEKVFEICQNNNLNVSLTWQRINDYSIEIYKGYKSSYELIFYTDGDTKTSN